MGKEWLEREGDVATFDWAFFGGESEEEGQVGLRAMDGERVDPCGW